MSDGSEQARSVGDSENKDLQRQQPGGGINPKVLLIVGAVIVLGAIVTLIVLLTGS